MDEGVQGYYYQLPNVKMGQLWLMPNLQENTEKEQLVTDPEFITF